MATPVATAPITTNPVTNPGQTDDRRATSRRSATHVCRLDGFDRARGGFSPRVSDQCRQALANGAHELSERGLSIGDVVRVVYLVRDVDAFSSCFPLLRDVFGDTRPAATLRLVTGFENPAIKIELELIANTRPAG